LNNVVGQPIVTNMMINLRPVSCLYNDKSVKCKCCGFVAAKLELRLTLFYVCNEVVQTCRKKHAVVYKDAFKEILRDAALLVRLLL